MKKILLILAIIILVSCGTGNRLEITSFEPTGKVERLTTFTIAFDRNIAPDSLVERWTDIEFIRFSPSIAGKFKWSDNRTLIFSPDVALMPMTKYSALPTNKLLFGSDLSFSSDEYIFETPDFDLVSVDFFYNRVPEKEMLVQIRSNLNFNYPVNPAELPKYLEIYSDGLLIKNYNIVTNSNSELIAIDFGEVTQSEEDLDVKLIVKSGLFSTYGKKALNEVREFDYTLPAMSELEVVSATTGFDGEINYIDVTFSQPLNYRQISDYIELEPGRRYSTEVYDNKVRIISNLQDLQTINVIIKENLPGLFGGKLKNKFSRELSLVELYPQVVFKEKEGRFLLRQGLRNVEIQSVNNESIEIEIYQIFKNNINFFLGQNRYVNYDYPQYYYPGNYGRKIVSKSIKLEKMNNWLQTILFNFERELVAEHEGIFLLTARSGSDRWIQDSRIICLSDIGIIAKTGTRNAKIFANKLSTSEPMQNVKISVISENNQTLFSGVTDPSGMVSFEDYGNKIKEFVPALILAEYNSDMAFLDMNATKFETSRFDVAGKSFLNPNLQAFIYGDRDLYRPGEILYLSAVIRDISYKKIPDEPFFLKIYSPDGKVFSEEKVSLNNESSFETKIQIPDYALTGGYRAELRNGSKILSGVYNFKVEDFVPDRLKIFSKLSKADFRPGDKIRLDIESEFMFGGKAGGLNYECELQFHQKRFLPSKFSDYTFLSADYDFFGRPEFIEGTLDKNGKAQIEMEVPPNIYYDGVVEGYIFISVFDLNGRPVNKAEICRIITEEKYLGIKTSGEYFGSGDKISFKLLMVDQDENFCKNTALKTELIKKEYNTVLTQDYGSRFVYRSTETEKIIWEKTIQVNGSPSDLSFALNQAGKYELRFYIPGSDLYRKYQFFVFDWGNSSLASFQADKEGRVEIIPEKKNYKSGEEIKILFTTPFDGKMLVSIEQGDILETKYLEVKNRSAEMRIKAEKRFIPNIFINALLFRPHDITAESPLLVGHGITSVKVESDEYRLPLSISAPAKIKPGQKTNILIKTKPEKDIYITLSAVDEGILQVSNYNSPDIYSWFFADRMLGVETYDLYKFLLPEISSKTGGSDLASQILKRSNPIKSKRFKPVAVWSGILKTSSDGTASIPLNVENYNGEVRLMATAYKGSRFGSAVKSIKVASDIIMEPAFPRVLGTGDSLSGSVNIINNSKRSGEITLNIECGGPVKINGQKRFKKKLSSSERIVFEYSLIAENVHGEAYIVFKTEGLENLNDKIDFSVRPNVPYSSSSKSGKVLEGKTVELIVDPDYLKKSREVKLSLSRFPAVQFASQLKNLIGYPYGCLEQTVSKVFPLIYLDELAKISDPVSFRYRNPMYYVREGIKKIESMYQPSGLISYWQGSSEINLWSNIYAGHFLLEAKLAGFNINENKFQKLLSAIGSSINSRTTRDFRVQHGTGEKVIKIAPKENVYGLYLLALAGKPDFASMNYYKSKPHLLTIDMKYLLSAALAHSGQRTAARSLMPKQYLPVQTPRETGGTFDSELRANSIILNSLLETEPESSQIPVIIKYLSERIKTSFSTQENAFALLAMGKAAKRSLAGEIRIEISGDGKKLSEFNKTDLVLDNDLLKGIKKIKLNASGSGEAYYSLETSGISKSGKIKEIDSEISVRRTIIDQRSGNPADLGSIKQGQLLKIQISITSGFMAVDNIMVSDLVPAGFEIENPRLQSDRRVNYDGSSSDGPEFIDIRDDRVNFAINIAAGKTYTFSYLARAVSRGNFYYPSITAEAMYDPNFRSVHGGKTVQVR